MSGTHLSATSRQQGTHWIPPLAVVAFPRLHPSSRPASHLNPQSPGLSAGAPRPRCPHPTCHHGPYPLAAQGPLPSLDSLPLPRADLQQALLEVVKHPEGIWVCICSFCPGRVSAKNTTEHWLCKAGRMARACREHTSVGLWSPRRPAHKTPKSSRDAFVDSGTPRLTGLPSPDCIQAPDCSGSLSRRMPLPGRMGLAPPLSEKWGFVLESPLTRARRAGGSGTDVQWASGGSKATRHVL